MVDLASQLADDKRNDIRIEAALAKLWASEMAWLIADELVQIRGGRGYETAASLAARGERGVPAEQMLRDLRINRIFEGSTEIMHLFIAREAVDTHLSVAGDLIEPGASPGKKARAARKAGGFYARWLPTLVAGEGQRPGAYQEFGPLATHVRYVERTSRKLARATFYGMSRWQGKLERKQGFLGRIVDIGAELFAISAVCVRAQMEAADGGPGGRGAASQELADAFCRQSRVRIGELFSGAVGQHGRPRCAHRQECAQRPVHVARRRHHRPIDRWPMDRHRRAWASHTGQRAPHFRLGRVSDGAVRRAPAGALRAAPLCRRHGLEAHR